jgi:hypothetical protein
MINLCEDKLEELAGRDPNSFVQLVRGGRLSPPSLTYAAEILGKCNAIEESVVVEVLLELSWHESSLVREGAVYGLSNSTAVFEVIRRLKEMAKSDVSQGVRESAQEAFALEV